MIYPPNQKPPIWSIDPGVIAYNCQKAGMPHPVGAWPFWEGAGRRALDYSGHGNHGSLESTTSWTADGLSFNGTGDYVSILDDNSLDLTTEFTISMWIYRNVDSGSYERIIFKSDKNGAELRDWTYGFQIMNTDDLQVIITDASNNSIHLIGNATINLGQLYHILATKNSTEFAIYIDGNLDNSGITSGIMADCSISTHPLEFGRLGTAGANYYSFNGIINNAGIFNTALSAAQVKYLSNNPYFMYQIPEEMYGYVAAAAGISIPLLMQQMNQYDGGTYALC